MATGAGVTATGTDAVGLRERLREAAGTPVLTEGGGTIVEGGNWLVVLAALVWRAGGFTRITQRAAGAEATAEA